MHSFNRKNKLIRLNRIEHFILRLYSFIKLRLNPQKLFKSYSESICRICKRLKEKTKEA